MKVISVNITTGHYDLDLLSLKFTAGRNPGNKRNLMSQQIVSANKTVKLDFDFAYQRLSYKTR